jgi:hypothetical protein
VEIDVLAMLGAGAWFGYTVIEGKARGDQFQACLDAAYATADMTTHNAGDRSARYDFEAINCAKDIERRFKTCWPIGDRYAGDPTLCKE